MRAGTLVCICAAMVLAASCTLIGGGDDLVIGPGSGGTGGATVTGGGGTDAGGGGSTLAECEPALASGPVADSCGVFVSASNGDNGNPGTKAAPFATIAHAVAHAGGGAVYLCGGETFTEAVELPAGVDVFGALDCATDWSYNELVRTELTAEPDAIVLQLTGPGSSIVADVNITAADAAAAGASSIAVLVSERTASFERCNLTAGAGAPGAAGTAPVTADLDGIAGDSGVEGCQDASQNFTPSPQEKTCPLGGTTQGGNGGTGYVGSASSGQDGTSDPPVDTPLDNNGAAQTATALCTAGTLGGNGAAGSEGPAADGFGSISAAGYSGAEGQAGGAGGPGQGGGGGGGTRGALSCFNFLNAAASGGNGGSGGCGGGGGAGGFAGGGSFALLSVDAGVTLATCTLTAAAGGGGGQGGDGEAGGLGAGGGNGGANDGAVGDACDGGGGGEGGAGGPGGGGLGGHSVGIAFIGTPPAEHADTVSIEIGAAGLGGDGGTGHPDGQGADGQACRTLDFDSGTCTSA